MQEVCGAFSHTKVLEPLDVLVPTLIPMEVCTTAVNQQMYTKEDGNTLPIVVNHNYIYKYISHGKLSVSTDNVACQGADIMINGEIHKSIVTLVTVQLEFKGIDIEIDTMTAVDLDLNTPLPIACA